MLSSIDIDSLKTFRARCVGKREWFVLSPRGAGYIPGHYTFWGLAAGFNWFATELALFSLRKSERKLDDARVYSVLVLNSSPAHLRSQKKEELIWSINMKVRNTVASGFRQLWERGSHLFHKHFCCGNIGTWPAWKYYWT